jgi:hypothetical protein
MQHACTHAHARAPRHTCTHGNTRIGAQEWCSSRSALRQTITKLWHTCPSTSSSDPRASRKVVCSPYPPLQSCCLVSVMMVCCLRAALILCCLRVACAACADCAPVSLARLNQCRMSRWRVSPCAERFNSCISRASWCDAYDGGYV